MNWKTIHGEGDDPLMPGTYVIEAHGVTFDPPVKVTDVAKAIQRIGAAARTYVHECIETNKKLRKSLPDDSPQMRDLGRRVLEQILDAHREKTGQTIMILRVNDRKLSKENRNEPNKEREEHTRLVAKYCDGDLPMRADDLNRAIMVGLCEDKVLLEERRVKMRSKISSTPKSLWAYVKSEADHLDDTARNTLLATLVSEGWVLFMRDGEVMLLPYGKGVPAYCKDHLPDHPAWSRDPAKVWEV